MPLKFEIEGQLVDLQQRAIYPAKISVEEGKINRIERLETVPGVYIMPGFIDAHIHIESSMLTPTAFSRVATTFGTIATVSDPHEIANVCGMEGIQYMIDNARHAALKFNFGAPSCVPATGFETAGAVIDAEQIKILMAQPEIKYLAEMMNFPGVLYKDAEVMQKLHWAGHYQKPIDGHAPHMSEADVSQYAGAGISTDHECTSLEEALYKIKHGMKILIREGSAAKNFEALVDLFSSHPEALMFCSDDKHPDELIKGHINQLVARAVAKGFDLFDVLYAACIAPVEHYALEVGQLQVGDAADFIVVSNLSTFDVLQTYIDGHMVAAAGENFETPFTPAIINHFNRHPVQAADFRLEVKDAASVSVQVIEALEGQLITTVATAQLAVEAGVLNSDLSQDVLKIAVVNRYKEAPVALGFIRNFGLQRGAIASTVAHDSHNIVVVGVTDEAMQSAVNALVASRGGIVVAEGDQINLMPLPIAGLITDKTALEAAAAYESLDLAAKTLGCRLAAPFMTLSFMALPVIPSLKMTDKGLFNVDSFNFTSLIKSKHQ
ncbi:adenine deaminase [Taibaiella sp. KBW10]|nr:adenine deaminase [Taibaiella sp. KBW10]